MPTTFKHATEASIGTGPVDVLSVGTGIRATVIGCNLANITEYDTINVDVHVVSEDSAPATFIKGIAVPPNSAVKIITNGEKLILTENTSLRIVSDTPDSLSAIVSYVEIS